MHASTSPLYPIIVSNDITAAMMDGPGGAALTDESIQEAVAFRQTMGRVHRSSPARGEWFFNTWNADTVKDPKTGKKVAFEDAPRGAAGHRPGLLGAASRARRGTASSDLEDGYCMLDPIKVSIVTPGVADKGGLDKRGIPATLVTAYLHRSRRRGREDDGLHDPVPVLDRHHQGQVGHAAQRAARLQARLRQQRAAGAGAAAARRATIPRRYGGLGLRDLADQMFAQLKETRGRRTGWPRRSRRCRRR